MPGFHEDEGEAWHADADADDALPLPPQQPRPPHSAPASSQPSASEQPHASSSKPRSSAATSSEQRHEQAQETFECPICTSQFKDNDALNAHIDWCLSREAIRSAQADDSSSAPKSTVGPSSKSSTGPKSKPAVSKPGQAEWWKAPPTASAPSKKRKTKR